MIAWFKIRVSPVLRVFRRSRSRVILRIRALLGQPALTAGRLSVIVPIYNVESFIERTLHSLETQNYPNFEVIMIDDGSTDRSAEIASQVSNRDGRFKLFQQRNAGLGAARNAGVALARGRFITFVDSDDVVPRDAFRQLLGTLKKTKSQFAIGKIERVRGTHIRAEAWVSRLHAKDRLQISALELPETTQDVFVCNKIFRTDFFRRVCAPFPEGIFYEDQVVTARAFASSGHFDLLKTSSYLWVTRDDDSSITQRRAELKNLLDRITAIHEVWKIYKYSDKALAESWLRRVLAADLVHFYRVSYECSKEYQEKLTECVTWLVQCTSEELLESIPFRERLLIRLVMQDDFETLKTVLEAQRKWVKGVPTKHGKEGVAFDAGAWGLRMAAIPKDMRVLLDTDLPLRSEIYSYSWVEPGVIRLTANAYRDNLPDDSYRNSIKLWAVDLTGIVGSRQSKSSPEVELRGGQNNIPSGALSWCSSETNPEQWIPIPLVAASTTLSKPLTASHHDFSSSVFQFDVDVAELMHDKELVTFLIGMGERIIPLRPTGPEHYPYLEPYQCDDGSIVKIAADSSDGVQIMRVKAKGASLPVRNDGPRPILIDVQTGTDEVTCTILASKGVNNGGALSLVSLEGSLITAPLRLNRSEVKSYEEFSKESNNHRGLLSASFRKAEVRALLAKVGRNGYNLSAWLGYSSTPDVFDLALLDGVALCDSGKENGREMVLPLQQNLQLRVSDHGYKRGILFRLKSTKL